MLRRILGVFFVRTLGGVTVRLLVALGLATVTLTEAGQEVITVHPVVAGTAVTLDVLAIVSLVGSFVLAVAETIHNW